MSITIEPTPAALPPDQPVGTPPDYPMRPLPAGGSRRARRTAARLRLTRLIAAVAVGAGLAAVAAVTVPAPTERQAGPAPVPSPPGPEPSNPSRPIPRTAVGLGANAWVHAQGWCIGDLAADQSTGVVNSCRFLPRPGGLDVAVLNPGEYAPAGYSLVVAVAIGPTAPPASLRGRLTDAAGSGDMATDRVPGLPGVMFLWGFSRTGAVSVEVLEPDGSSFASCNDCMAAGRIAT
ncbi:hypothetical protein [Streptodolium elevatio]|uniref:Uncharacterized protein n=1 Tax=Streptodolium elevatio TaxID=3157996 RepID=A0ABV3DIP9_9ACTN